MRAGQARGVALVQILIADDEAVLIQLAHRHIECGALVAARNRQGVIDRAPSLKHFGAVIVGRHAIGNRRTPREEVRVDQAVDRRAAAAGHAQRADAVLALHRDRANRIVERNRRTQVVGRRSGVTALGAVLECAGGAGARAVDGRGCGALEDVHRFDVVGVDVGGTIGRRRAGQHCLATRGIADRDAVEDDHRLAGAERLGPADLDRRRGARVTAALIGQHVGHLARECLNHILLVGAGNGAAVDRRGRRRQPLAPLLRSGARHHHHVEAQRIGRELEVLLDRGPGRHGDGRATRAKADEARIHLDLLSLGARAGNTQAIGAVRAGPSSDAEFGDGDVDVAQRFTARAGDFSSDGHWLLRSDPRRQQGQQ